jgi:hypothetical protein
METHMTDNCLKLIVRSTKQTPQGIIVEKGFDLLKEGCTLPQFRYAATRKPEKTLKVYNRADTKEFQNVLIVRKPVLNIPDTLVLIAYEYHKDADKDATPGDEDKGKIDIPYVEIPLSSLLQGFEVSKLMHQKQLEMDAILNTWIDGRNPPVSKEVNKPQGITPVQPPAIQADIEKENEDIMGLFATPQDEQPPSDTPGDNNPPA